MRALRRFDVGIFGKIVLVLSIALLVDAFWLRLQVWLSGEYLMPAAGLKPLVALAALAAVLLLRKRLPGGILMFAVLTFAVVMFLSFTNLVLQQGVSVQDALISQNAYFWSFLLMPLVLGLRASVSSLRFTRVLLWIGIPLAAFGLLQFVLQHPIVSIEVPEAGFQVNSWRFHGTGHLRAFSLFGSGQTFGYLLAPLLALLCVRVVRARGRQRIWFVILALLVAGATAATLTRNTYLVVGFAVVSAITYLTPLRRVVWLLPVIAVAVAVVGVSTIAAVSPGASSEGVLDATSLWIRLGEWRDLLQSFAGSSVSAQLFGQGLVQNEQASGSVRVLIDNSYLAVLLNSGILGLTAWLALMCTLWTYLHVSAVRSMDEGAITVAAAFSAWGIGGLFNVSIAVFGIYGIWAFLLVPRRSSQVTTRRIAVEPSARRTRSVSASSGATGATTSAV